MDINNLPEWVQIAIFLFGSGGIAWSVWTKFGDSISSFFKIKNEIKSGTLDNNSTEIDVMSKYKAFIDKQLTDMMERQLFLEKEVQDYGRAHRRKTKYIKYLLDCLVQNEIQHKSINDEQFN